LNKKVCSICLNDIYGIYEKSIVKSSYPSRSHFTRPAILILALTLTLLALHQ
jgi:hypothetical protein